MRKVLLVLITMLSVAYAVGQGTKSARPLVEYRGTTMVSVFAGGHVAQKNVNNRGNWYGIYLEHLPLQLLISEYKHLNLGLTALAAKSLYEGNDQEHKNSNTDYSFGFGIGGGFYNYRFSKNSAIYIGANSLIKRGQEIINGRTSESAGRYLADGQYIVWSSELNINVMKTYESGLRNWPRTQLRLVYQKPIQNKRDAFWDAVPLSESAVWDKTVYMSELKASFYRYGKRVILEPKVITGYHFYEGDNSQWIIAGLELALRKFNWDDFLSVSFSLKRQVGDYTPNLNETQFLLGINFMPFNLKR